jgi:uncharacterized protein
MSYFDTSVVVAYYCPEIISERVERMILKDREPIISALTIVEFASALSRKSREKTLTRENAIRIWEQFTLHRLKDYYSIKTLEDRYYVTATSWIMQLKTSLRTLDALHLTVAWESGTTIITADKVLAKSAETFGVPHVLVD